MIREKIKEIVKDIKDNPDKYRCDPKEHYSVCVTYTQCYFENNSFKLWASCGVVDDSVENAKDAICSSLKVKSGGEEIEILLSGVESHYVGSNLKELIIDEIRFFAEKKQKAQDELLNSIEL